MSRDDTERGGFRGLWERNGAWYAASAVMLAVALGVVGILVWPAGGGDSPTAPGPAPTAAPSPAGLGTQTAPATPTGSPTPEPGWRDLGCNGTRGDTTIPSLPPKVTWDPVGTMSAPRSPDLGPAKIDGFARTCFQHSPSGALAAATNFTVVSWTVPTRNRLAVLGPLVTAGEVRTEIVGAETGPTGGARIVAAHVEGCAPERCNLVIAFSVGSQLVATSLSMVWAGGDWRLDGTANEPATAIDAVPPGYLAWKA
jgi:hypothetical protein